MANEADILQIIADNPQISQRKIAEKTGISLGQVNFLIKKCAKKGLIKIEGQSSKSIRYNITPKGIKEKAELTLQYIKLSYKAIINLTYKITEISKEHRKKNVTIYVLDTKDEMMEIIKLGLNRALIKYEVIDDISKINKNKEYVLYIWEDKDFDDINTFNVLNEGTPFSN